jgi:hypothetical protein
MNLKTRKFEVFEQGSGLHSLIIFNNRRLAAQVNKLLAAYPADTKFSASDEVLFRSIPHEKLNAALKLAGHKNLA